MTKRQTLPAALAGRGSIYRQLDRSQNYILKYYVQGHPHTVATGTADWDEACRLLAQHLGQAVDGTPIPAPGDRYTFEAAAQAVEDHYFIKGRRSIEDLKRRIRKHLRPFFGPLVYLEAITDEHVTAFQKAQLQAGYSHAEINRECAALSKMLTLARRARRIRLQPNIERLDESGNVRRGFFEPAQYAAVHRALANEGAVGAVLQDATKFSSIMGWRFVSEILTLEWPQIDHTAGTIQIYTSKNDAGRTFPYHEHPELVPIVAALWRRRQTLAKEGQIVPHIFHVAGNPLYRRDKHGRAYMIPAAWDAWHAACAAAGVPGRIPHDFRRTVVRTLTRASVNEKRAMAVTGHKTRSVFDRYDIINPDDLAQAVKQMAAYQQTETATRRTRRPR